MRTVTGDQLGDFAAIYEADVELVSVSRPQWQTCEALSKRLIDTRQVPTLRWVQAANDADGADNVLPPTVEADVRSALVGEIAAASEVLSELVGCDQVGVRLETLSAPMCPRFHVDYVPCRMLITLSGKGTEWIPNSDVDWEVFENLQTAAPPLKGNAEVQHLTTGNWSLLKGGAWNAQFHGVVHRSPHGDGERLLLSLDPIL